MEMQKVIWPRAGSVAQGRGLLTQKNVPNRKYVATANRTLLHMPGKEMNLRQLLLCLLDAGKEHG